MDAKVEKGEHQWPIMQEGRIFVQSVQNSLRQRWLFFYFEVGSTIYIQNHFNFVFEDDKCAVRKKTYMLKLFNFNILFLSNEGLQMFCHVTPLVFWRFGVCFFLGGGNSTDICYFQPENWGWFFTILPCAFGKWVGQKPPTRKNLGCLGYISGNILPSYVGIIS